MNKDSHIEKWMGIMQANLEKSEKKLKAREDKEAVISFHTTQIELLQKWIGQNEIEEDIREELKSLKEHIERSIAEYEDELARLKANYEIDKTIVDELKKELKD